MATVVLQTVGAAVGSALGGPVGGAIGQTIGAIAGSQIDQKLFGPGDQKRTGPRLDSTRTLTSQEGNAIARVFGRAKISGEVIWATRFEEVSKTQTQKQGGKGANGPKTTTTTYSYFGNFAVALCEGEISRIGRIWLDGKVVDRSSLDARFYPGTYDQPPDPLIEAKQGVNNAPAYRGISYIVFDRLPLADYGNRIPQVAVEIIKSTGEVGKGVRAVNIIPGATEFGYDTQEVQERVSRLETRSLNIHQTDGVSDFVASLDDLQAQCPNLEQVALVVAWFGSDLRADKCVIEPKVEVNTRSLVSGNDWSVAGFTRAQASLVSSTDGQLSYGGTPSDASVLRAIAELKSRGLRVCINPFLMMDVPASNTLPNPYGGASQPALPWRGRITCDPAIGQPETVDQTATATTQIAQFVSGQTENETLNYHRFITHYANLAQQAGGVDMFIIGSEMKGLTSVRGIGDTFPFVDALETIASQVKSVLGNNCIVTYGADWSEYFGYQPPNTGGDIFYNLDPLWANSSIDAVGIDNYFPLSDWREFDNDFEEGESVNDIGMLNENIAGGEGFQWYYANTTDRQNRTRTDITDGLGKPWVYRNKDLISWWSNQHFNRQSGVEAAGASPWQPEMKPIIFTEFGAPAVHNGASQPNVFFDPKSSENALPYFSNGGRDDEALLNYHLAMQQYWDKSAAAFDEANNPLSNVYGNRMVDFSRSQAWAWDARPYPAFPYLEDVWGDSANWYRGHWLNGRLGVLKLADLIKELLAPYNLPALDVSGVMGSVDGYVVAEITSARSAIEALLELYSISVFEDGGTLIFRSPGKTQPIKLTLDDVTLEEDVSLTSVSKAQQTDLPQSVALSYLASNLEYNTSTLEAQRINGQSIRQVGLAVPLVSSSSQLRSTLERWLNNQWVGQETSQFSLSKIRTDLTLGDTVMLPGMSNNKPWKLISIEEGKARKITARAIDVSDDLVTLPYENQISASSLATYSKPQAWFLNLPIIPGAEDKETNRIAVSSVPWRRNISIFSSPSDTGFSFRQNATQQATTGIVLSGMPVTTVFGRWNYTGSIEVELDYGQLSSVEEIEVLRGVNAAAVRSLTGEFEIFQFAEAKLTGPKRWQLSKLLRGQLGTEAEAFTGADTDADIILLDEAVEPIQGVTSSRGLPLNWKIGPDTAALTESVFETQTFTPGYRGLSPYTPVHLKLVQDENGWRLSWTRRNRIGSDDWAPSNIPMSEEKLEFEIRVANVDDESLVRRSPIEVLNLSTAELQTVFGFGSHGLRISVAQVSAVTGVGPFGSIQRQIHL